MLCYNIHYLTQTPGERPISMRYTIALCLTTLLASTAAYADVPKVVTDFGPIDSLVRQVMGDLGQPVMLLPPGGDPHDFQMKPSQAQALADADLIFWDGPVLMPALGDAIATLGTNAKSVPLLQAGGGKIRVFDGDEGTDPMPGWTPPMPKAGLPPSPQTLAPKTPPTPPSTQQTPPPPKPPSPRSMPKSPPNWPRSKPNPSSSSTTLWAISQITTA